MIYLSCTCTSAFILPARIHAPGGGHGAVARRRVLSVFECENVGIDGKAKGAANLTEAVAGPTHAVGDGVTRALGRGDGGKG